EIHQIGLETVARIQSEIASLIDGVGFSGTAREYLRKVEDDSEWQASDVDELSRAFHLYLRRIEPLIPQYFGTTPQAEYGIEPLSPARSASMTFGYYDIPTSTNPRGNYVFNASNM